MAPRAGQFDVTIIPGPCAPKNVEMNHRYPGHGAAFAYSLVGAPRLVASIYGDAQSNRLESQIAQVLAG